MPIIADKLIPFVLLLSVLSPGGRYYRYLELTPAMAILPRGELEEAIAGDVKCFLITETSNSMVVRGFDRGEPFPVFGLSPEITVAKTDSVVYWLLEDFTYRLDLDSRGRPRLLSRTDNTGRILPGPDGGAFVRWEWEDGGAVVVRSLDSLGATMPVKVPPVYAGTAAELNEDGSLVYFRFQSVSASGFRYILDDSGRSTSRTAVDHHGLTVVTDEGIAETRYGYDQDGNTVFSSYHDLEGVLLPREYELPASGNWDFDDRGIVVNGCGIAFVKREYDENCLYVSETNIGLDGEPVSDPQGRVVTEYLREIHGGIAASMWYGPGGDPVEVAGIWATRRIYDSRGMVLETSTWDSDDRIAEFPGGFAFTRFSYTDWGDVEMISYYGANGEPVVNSALGCHARDHRYDEDGHLAEIRYLGVDYSLMNNSSGYARAVYTRSPEGVEEAYYDMDGERL